MPEDPTSDAYALFALFVSFAALLVSAATLYWHHLRPGKVIAVAGEHLNVYHSSDGSCGISVPLSLANLGARTATVRRLGLLLCAAGASEGYLLEPFLYEKVDEKANSITDSLPLPIPIPGKGVATKQVLFRSAPGQPPELQLLKPGTFAVILLVWTERSTEPHSTDAFEVQVSDSDALRLQQGIT